MTQTPTIYLIDADATALEALGHRLESKGFRVHPYRAAEPVSVLDLGQEGGHCVVSEVCLPGLSGIELIQSLRRRGLTTPVILITSRGDIDTAVTAIKAGAHDFLVKPLDEHRLVASIEEAVAAHRKRQVAESECAELCTRRTELSDRQQQVMDLAVQGLTNKEIGAALGISPRTVEIYRARVMERMGARTLADLVRIALAVTARS